MADPKGFCARGVIAHATAPPRSARARPSRSRPAIVDGDRKHGQSERRREVDDPRVAGILHRDSIAGTHMGLERELDAVERAADHGHVVAGHAVAVEACRCECEQLRVRAGCAIEHRLMWQRTASAGPRSGRRAGSGLPESRSTTPAGTIGLPARRRRDARSDGGPEPAGARDESSTAQLPVCGSDGRRADPAMGRERSDRRQTRSRSELTVANAALDTLRDLGRPPSGDVITYRYVHRFVS